MRSNSKQTAAPVTCRSKGRDNGDKLGALAIASAVHDILDLSPPYSGFFRASPAPLERVLAQMSRDQGKVGGQR
jgi:hypothetical protein